MGAGVGSFTRRIIGVVTDGDSTAYVLYRSEGSGVRYEDAYHVEVLPTVRRGGRWYVRRSSGEQDFGSLSYLMLRLEGPEFERE